jgi:hypothetical protein
VVVVTPFSVLVVGVGRVIWTAPNCPVWLAAMVLPSPGMNMFTPS